MHLRCRCGHNLLSLDANSHRANLSVSRCREQEEKPELIKSTRLNQWPLACPVTPLVLCHRFALASLEIEGLTGLSAPDLSKEPRDGPAGTQLEIPKAAQEGFVPMHRTRDLTRHDLG